MTKRDLDIQRDTREAHALKERPCTDTGRRQLPASQGERPQQTHMVLSSATQCVRYSYKESHKLMPEYIQGDIFLT